MSDVFSLLIAFILGIVANYSYDQLSIKFRKKKGDYLQAILKDVNNWITSNGEIYFYSKDPSYNIKINEGQDNLADRFKKFPDREHDKISWVEVRFNDATLFGWNFMHLDGYRFLVPVPNVGMGPDGLYYDYYDLNSIEIKVIPS